MGVTVEDSVDCETVAFDSEDSERSEGFVMATGDVSSICTVAGVVTSAVPSADRCSGASSEEATVLVVATTGVVSTVAASVVSTVGVMTD
jgi:hypothetical protein